jgi:hypothetical protein
LITRSGDEEQENFRVTRRMKMRKTKTKKRMNTMMKKKRRMNTRRGTKMKRMAMMTSQRTGARGRREATPGRRDLEEDFFVLFHLPAWLCERTRSAARRSLPQGRTLRRASVTPAVESME